MLNGKSYVIWDPALAVSGLRNKDLSSLPFVLDVTAQALQVTKPSMAKIIGDGTAPIVDEMMHAIPASLAGENLKNINTVALALIAETLNDIGKDVVDLPNLWLWYVLIPRRCGPLGDYAQSLEEEGGATTQPSNPVLCWG